MRFEIYQASPEKLVIKQADGDYRSATGLTFDQIFRADSPQDIVASAYEHGETTEAPSGSSLPPIGSQEIWAAGVTYFRSRTARMEEAESGGGDIFYDKVYEAPRPELFFKSTAQRTRGHEDPVCIRPDSTWDVPEPELTLAINHVGKIFGYTIGNDMSSRSIEGENPLYLPQAKVYKGSCAIGPCLVVDEAPGKDTVIKLQISRSGDLKFSGETNVGQIKRGLDELAGYLFHSNEFPDGAYLMTGTGVVPDSDFTLAAGDVIEITIEGIGLLRNTVEVA